MEYCNIYIYTFIITALWDIVLRKMSENYDSLPKFLQMDFVRYLQPYFKQLTLLDAALVAGFVGATTQVIILNLHSLPTDALSFVSFMIVSFIISALYGFVIKFSLPRRVVIFILVICDNSPNSFIHIFFSQLDFRESFSNPNCV